MDNNDIPDKLKIMIDANWETAQEMSLEEMAVVVMEGVHNLLSAIGADVDIKMSNLPEEYLEDVVNNPYGRVVITSLSDIASAMATVLVSIEQMQSLFPEEYDEHVKRFRQSVDEKIEKQEDAIVEEFIRSIPDAPPPPAEDE